MCRLCNGGANEDLKNHCIMHIGEKQFMEIKKRGKLEEMFWPKTPAILQCNSQNLLRRHERLHTGDKPFQCEVCQMKFTTGHLLIRHGVVHTGVKPFQCKLCGNRFSCPDSLWRHVKNKHKEGGEYVEYSEEDVKNEYVDCNEKDVKVKTEEDGGEAHLQGDRRWKPRDYLLP